MTIRDTINRQKESRESAERAKQERFAKAEAEALAAKEAEIAAKAKAEADAKARLKAKEEARLQAIADAKAQKIADELAKAEAKAQEKAAIEAEAKALKKAKLQAKADAKAQKLAQKQAQIDAKLKAKADAVAKEQAKQEARAKAEAERQAIVLAKEKAKREAEALAEKKAKFEAEALAKEKIRLETEAAAKLAAEAKRLAKIKAKEEAQAKASQDAKAKTTAKQEAKVRAEKARLEKTEAKAKAADLKAKAEEKAAKEAKLAARVKAESKDRAEKSRLDKADAKAVKEAKLAAKAKADAIALEAKKAEAAAKELAQARAIEKAELKEKAREKALLKAQKRSKVWNNLKKTSEQKVKYIATALVKAIESIRSYAGQISLQYFKINLRNFARITYGTVIIGVVVMMTQVFMDRYPQTSNSDIIYELPIDPEFAVIESPEHEEKREEIAPLAIEKNLTVSVTSSVAVSAPVKHKSLPEPDPVIKEPAIASAAEPTIEPVSSLAMLANWQINAVESDIPAGYPRLVVVIDDIGMSTSVSQKLAKLPAPLTLAFLPYATRLGYQSRLVASYGHELLVHMPMAPKSLNVNPGKNALLDDLDKVEFERRLNWNLSRFTGFIGINNHMGSSLTEHTKEMRWVMDELKSRGLVFLDSVTTSDSVAASQAQLVGVPTLSRNVFLDNNRDKVAILKQFKLAMRMSQRRGLSIAIGHPYPETIAVLKEWLPKLNSQGIVLTPLSAAISEKYFPKTILASKDVPSLARAK